MKQFPYFALLVVLLSGCLMPGLSAATPTPMPTSTKRPTATPLPPTATATLTPTATPDIAATQAAKTTETAGDVLGELEEWMGTSDIPYQDGQLIWKQSRPVSIEMSGPDYQILELDEDVTAGNFILKSDVTWEATGILICGAVFRSEPNLLKGKQYQFMFLRFSGLPAWTIEVHEYGLYKNSPVKTKFSDVLDLSNGATNEFILVAQDDHFTVYFNKVRQGTYYDYSLQRSEGAFGFTAYQQSGKGGCTFENSWIWAWSDE